MAKRKPKRSPKSNQTKKEINKGVQDFERNLKDPKFRKEMRKRLNQTYEETEAWFERQRQEQLAYARKLVRVRLGLETFE